MPISSASYELDLVVDQLHGDQRLRVWSIIITIFGDAVVPRGGVIWLGALQELMGRLRIEPGAVRAAMSRLTADGWLQRERRGRTSYYALTDVGRASFDQVTPRIYAGGAPDWDGAWTIAIASEQAGETRDARRQSLRKHDFGTIGPTVFLRPETSISEDASRALAGMTVFSARGKDVSSGYGQLALDAWPLEHVDAAYQDVIADFSPLLATLKFGDRLDPLSALAARVLLIHAYRRVILRDPMLPEILCPADWSGAPARDLVSQIYRSLVPVSETWLDNCQHGQDEALPKPSKDFFERFGGVDFKS